MQEPSVPLIKVSTVARDNLSHSVKMPAVPSCIAFLISLLSSAKKMLVLEASKAVPDRFTKVRRVVTAA